MRINFPIADNSPDDAPDMKRQGSQRRICSAPPVHAGYRNTFGPILGCWALWMIPKLLLGTDFPFASPAIVRAAVEGIATASLDQRSVPMVQRENALSPVPWVNVAVEGLGYGGRFGRSGTSSAGGQVWPGDHVVAANPNGLTGCSQPGVGARVPPSRGSRQVKL